VDILTYQSPTGVISGCTDCRVHAGFLAAWQSVESTISASVKNEIATYPGYQIVITGHSLGAAIAALLVRRLSTFLTLGDFIS
jgi:putative lipase involved disintegration of autophagic bodies